MVSDAYPLHGALGFREDTPWAIDSDFPPGATKPPEEFAWQAISDSHRAAIARHLAVFKQLTQPLGQTELGFNRPSVQWLDNFLQLLHERKQGAQAQRYVPALGAFLGECLINSLGGEWALHKGNICVRLNKGEAAFPLAKVRRHLEVGREGGDSVLKLYDALDQSSPDAHMGLPDQADSWRPDMPDAHMASLLQALRASFKLRQSDLNMRTFGPNWVAPPPWMSQQEPLHAIIEQQFLLHTKGTIVWGALVQANKMLFTAGLDDCPGTLIYSGDTWFDARPLALRALAQEVFNLKNAQQGQAPQLAVAGLRPSEQERPMGRRLPPALTDKGVYESAFMVFRRHIPGGTLRSGCVPILVHPSTTAVMVVPCEFWPRQMVELWSAGQM
jgi:hypothetical protein